MSVFCLALAGSAALAFEINQDVLVQKADGNWYRGWVVKTDIDRNLVAYNWSANSMEWVETSRLQANQRAPVAPEQKQVTGWQNGEGSLWALDTSADGRWLAVASSAGWVQIFDQATLFPTVQLPGRKQAFQALAFSPDGQSLAACDQGGQVSLYQTGSWALQQRFQAGGRCDQLAFSQTGMLALSGDTADNPSGSGLWLYDPHQKRISATLLKRPYAVGVISALDFSPDGQYLAVGSSNQNKGVEVYKLQGLGLQLVKKWSTAGDVSTLAFNPNGQFLAGGGSDHLLQLWNWQKAQRFWAASVGSDAIALNRVAFSPDGQTLATCGSGSWKGVKLYRTGNGAFVKELGNHLSLNCTGVAYSQDGHSLFQVRQIFSNFNEKILDRYLL